MSKVFPAQYEIWVADLNPGTGSEPGKVRPVVILQNDILNKNGHSTFICCAISSQPKAGVSLIRLELEPSGLNGLLKKSYILCYQIRALDSARLKGKLGMLDNDTVRRLRESIKAILTL